MNNKCSFVGVRGTLKFMSSRAVHLRQIEKSKQKLTQQIEQKATKKCKKYKNINK